MQLIRQLKNSLYARAMRWGTKGLFDQHTADEIVRTIKKYDNPAFVYDEQIMGTLLSIVPDHALVVSVRKEKLPERYRQQQASPPASSTGAEAGA